MENIKNKNKNKNHHNKNNNAPVEQPAAVENVVAENASVTSTPVTETAKQPETVVEQNPNKETITVQTTETKPEVTQTEVTQTVEAKKEAPRGTKAELIRKHLSALGESAPLKDVANAVMKEAHELGFTELVCSPQDVSTAKFKKTPSGEPKKGETSSDVITLEDGLKVLKIAGEMGGMVKVAQMLKGVQPLLQRFPNIAKLQTVLLHLAKIQDDKEAISLLEPAEVEAEPAKG